MSAARRGRRPAAAARPGLGLAFGLVLVGLLEVGARIAGYEAAYQPDLIGGWRMVGEATDKIVTGTREPHRFHLTTNADGLRTTLRRARSADRRRVAVMGDSTTFGWGADEQGTVADGLGRGLSDAGLGEVEVMNAGQPGYTTVQVARFFAAIVSEYRPDLVIVFLPMHDHNLVLVSDLEHLRGASGLLPRARVGLATRSRLYEALRRMIFPLATKPFLVAGQEETAEPRVPRVSDTERAQVLEEMAATLKGWGGRLAVGHLPVIQDLTSASPQSRPGSDWAAAWTAETGTPLVDLRACCGPDGGGLVFDFDPGHLTAEGNLRAGRYGAAQVAALLGG
jgi:hypothetical protein